MKLVKADHKRVLNDLFFIPAGKQPDGRTTYDARTFPIEKLADASSAAKKLLKGSTTILNDKGEPTGLQFGTSSIEFSPDEAAILKELFDGKKEWNVADADIVLALRAIFAGKKEKEAEA